MGSPNAVISLETITIEGSLVRKLNSASYLLIKNEDAKELPIEWIWDGIRSPLLIEKLENKIVKATGRLLFDKFLADTIEEVV